MLRFSRQPLGSAAMRCVNRWSARAAAVRVPRRRLATSTQPPSASLRVTAPGLLSQHRHCPGGGAVANAGGARRGMTVLETGNKEFLRDVSELTEEELQERWVLDEAKNLSSKYYEDICSVEGSLGVNTFTSKEQLHRKLKQQLHQELFTFDATVKIYREMVASLTDLGLAASLKPEQRMLVHWYIPFSKAIEREHLAIRQNEPKKDRKAYGSYLVLMEPSKLAVITMYHCLNALLSENHAGFTHLALSIGRSVNTEHNLHKLQHAFSTKTLRSEIGVKADPRMVNRLAARLVGHSGGGGASGAAGRSGAAGHSGAVRAGGGAVELPPRMPVDPSSGGRAPTPEQHGAPVWSSLSDPPARADDLAIWDSRIHAKVGSALLEMLMETALVRTPEGETLTAFEHTYVAMSSRRAGRGAGGATKKQGVMQMHPQVVEMLEDSHALREMMKPRYLPMVVPPLPWCKDRSSLLDSGAAHGGYLKLQSQFMRTRGSFMQPEVLRRADLTSVLETLNFLGSVPWCINEPVLRVVEQVWAAGGGVAEIPRTRHHEIPDMPARTEGMDDAAYDAAVKRHRNIAKKLAAKNNDLKSLQADMRIKLRIAQDLRTEENIYFPLNLDFRGRVYPIPPNLNHLGNDMCRGLLTFSKPHVLGERGLRWLKIHVANVFGEDKLSMDGRAAFTESRLAEVRDSAERPMDGSRWWQQADKPWETLAACMELTRALDHPEGPEYFPSSLPVHQDGSCNGLQHYAALGRDVEGAKLVNLVEVGDRPADVYQGVCDLVRDVVRSEARGEFAGAAGARLSEEQREFRTRVAQMVEPFVVRKTVKQTVMTTVYGVTFIGAKKQIYERLTDHSYPGGPLEGESDNDLYDAAGYLATLTLGAVGKLFAGADRVKEWLRGLAQTVAGTGHPISWLTPVGLPIVQPYRRTGRFLVPTVVQTVVIANHDDDLPVHRQRQRSAFPPNYVHSLDSTHMMLTALKCKEAGVTFAAVHDSYWTQAGAVDDMNGKLREAFVEMHKQPLLQDLRESLSVRFQHLDFDPVPPLGDLDLDEVLKSTYFFN